MITNKPHGIGRMIFSNSSMYEGMFNEGKRTGYGRIIRSFDFYDLKLFHKDYYNGSGRSYVHYSPNGIKSVDVYTGFFDENAFNGTGQMVYDYMS